MRKIIVRTGAWRDQPRVRFFDAGSPGLSVTPRPPAAVDERAPRSQRAAGAAAEPSAARPRAAWTLRVG